MAADIYLAFGADVGGLEAGLAQAQAAVKATTAEMRSLASEMVKTGAATDSELGSRLADLGSKLADAKEHVTGFKEEMKGTEGEGFIGGMVEKVKDFLAPLNAAKLGLAEMTEALAAAFAVEKVVEFIRSMGELGESTERTAAILGATTEEVGALNYGMALTGTATDNLNRMMGRFQMSLAAAQSGTGNVAAGLQVLGLSAAELVNLKPEEQLAKIAEAVSKLADTPTKTAAVQALGRGFVELIPYLDQGAEGIERFHAQAEAAGVILSEGLTKNLVEMNHGFVDLGQSIEGDAITAFVPFIDVVDTAVAGLREMTQALQDNMRDGGAVAQVLFFIADALHMVEEAIAIVVHAMELLYNAIGAVLDPLLAAFQGLGRMAVALWADIASGDYTFSHMRAAGTEASAAISKSFNADFTAIKGDLNSLDQNFKDVFKTIVDGSKDAGDRMRDALHPPEAPGGAERPTAPAIDDSPWGKATREVENLTEALKANEDALAGRHSKVDSEFFSARGGGAHHPEEMAPAFADALEKAVKDAEAATGSKASFTELFRTYQQQADIRAAHEAMPGGVAAHPAAPPGTSMHEIGGAADLSSGAVLNWLHAHIGEYPELEFLTGSTGANDPGHIQFHGGRSSQSTLEASKANATTTGEPPTGEARDKLLEKQKELNLELDKAKQKLLDIKTEEAGGTETSKTKLAIDEADAKQKGDAVENAKKLQAAAEADLAAAEKTGATQERLTKLKTEVAKATEAVNTAEQKQAESGAKLDAAKAKAAGDTEKEKAAELALADIKIKAAGADVAARNAAEAEKLAIETRYADQSKSLALEKANEEVAAVRTAAQNKIKDIDLEAKAKQISESQKLALTKAALAEEIAAEKSIYEQELALDNLRPQERQKILAQLAAAEEQYAQKIKETQLKAAEDSSKAWQGMADKVAGILNSQVSGVISGTTSVKQAFSNMAKSIIEDVAKYAVKWAVEHAFAATQVMAQNTAVTTSALAGQAAQDAAKTVSGAAGVASQAANAVQSIAIDGAKTFGGVFGFLAPLLGPFAAGPAAGAQATVLAAGAAFDTGAWSLPHDMIAAVHQGEMVIPSRGGVADEFRSFMSGGGFDRASRGDVQQAGGNKNVSVNPSTHFHVNAIDGASAASFFQNNHKHIMTAVDRAVRHGSALGLRTFTR
jgi:hypothetical protein